MRRNLIWALPFLLASLVVANQGFAGSTVTGSYDGCASVSLPYIGRTYIAGSTIISASSAGGGAVSMTRTDQYIGHYLIIYDEGSYIQDIGCGTGTYWTIDNSDQPPEVGGPANSPSPVMDRIRQLIKKQPPRIPQGYDEGPRVRIGPGTAASGVRGSYGSSGWTLSEASPAYVAFDATFDRSSGSTPLVSFVVDNAGDGDWLSLYSGAEMYFHQPLSNFEVGVMYFVEIPLSALAEEHDQILTYWIDSAGEANASVYFSDDVTAEGWEFDTDADGMFDGEDNCTNAWNENQCDSDGDGYGNRCDGDMNNNGATNAQDTGLYRQQLGQPSVGPTYNKADLNCNGAVNAQDTGLYRQLLGSPPGPSGLVP